MTVQLETQQSCCLYRPELLDEFVEETILLADSESAREHFADQICAILPIGREELLRNSAAFFDVASAKMVLECRDLTTDDPYHRVSDLDHGYELKETCYKRFAARYQLTRKSQKVADETTYVPLNFLYLYDDALSAFSVLGVGRLLAKRLARRFHLHRFKVTTAIARDLAECIQDFGFRDFWKQHLLEDSDVFRPAHEEEYV